MEVEPGSDVESVWGLSDEEAVSEEPSAAQHSPAAHSSPPRAAAHAAEARAASAQPGSRLPLPPDCLAQIRRGVQEVHRRSSAEAQRYRSRPGRGEFYNGGAIHISPATDHQLASRERDLRIVCGSSAADKVEVELPAAASAASTRASASAPVVTRAGDAFSTSAAAASAPTSTFAHSPALSGLLRPLAHRRASVVSAGRMRGDLGEAFRASLRDFSRARRA